MIDSFTWSTSDVAGVKKTIKPWHLFLSNTAVKKKIENFGFLRGNLHIKTIINGSPFQYGALRLCYSPLLGFVSDKIRTNPSSDMSLKIPYSQQPGFYCYPQSNSGGEMPLRFFYNANWLDITSASDVTNMGTINYVIFYPLQSAVSGGSTSITVRTYAWMTDVELMGATSKFALQSDEYGNGSVSRPASALAALAGRLTEIPIIGTFARATQIGASAVSSIASLFGYTNVPVISDVMPYHPMNAPMLASAQIGVPAQKLTLDPKQELSIDPSPHGLGSEDELSLMYLKTKESLFGETSWTTSDTGGAVLLNARINPMLFGRVELLNPSSVTVGNRVYHTPLSYISALFKHWRGDIIIRVKVICTKFHKGRLKITFDPLNDTSVTNPDENTCYTQILDIGERDDIEFVIPYHQALAWSSVDPSLVDNWNLGNALAPRSKIDNGMFTVRVLNNLVAPASGSVGLLFFVRGGENFELANPMAVLGHTSAPPSFFALQSDDTTDLVPSQVTFGTPTKIIPERYDLNFGECVGSLRVLLHRSQMIETTPMPAGQTQLYCTFRKLYKRMPCTPGFDPSWTATSANKLIAASGNAPYCYNTMPVMTYIAGMFLGYRGSVTYCVTPSSDKYGFIDDIRAVRLCDTDLNGAGNRFIGAYTGSSHSDSVSRKAYHLNVYTNRRDGLAGCAITTTRTNGSLLFNFPDYNNRNFSFADPTVYVLGTSKDGTDEQGVALQIKTTKVASSDADDLATITLQTEACAGPDFTCLHFLCCPTLDYASINPAPV
ncbi:hypothetical protein 2 [Beihai picorna-like virus 49]|uniref:hypothetical protein 2 n=1 Tax=Beihai picorna-like virus 49 TaxID=1922593 RepID=UPI00090A86B1|nr:hypothetical protein 2 [Beihai picorna-like virus 49]APG78892.1 hypothetical protein 2 [Beihai picorna-like virus 49]